MILTISNNIQREITSSSNKKSIHNQKNNIMLHLILQTDGLCNFTKTRVVDKDPEHVGK